MFNDYVARKTGDLYLLVNIKTNEIMEIDFIISKCVQYVQNKGCFDASVFAMQNGLSLDEVNELWNEIINALGDE
ncbi:MAG: hypothetical protein Q4E51_09740 [Lachnospiraceae bacterium]|nr:hypothetical protein [Lachnospiraceae bacterium]